jgi:acetyl esterase/lipase
MPEAREEVYKTIGDVELKLYLFTPQDHSSREDQSAIVFFFGGGWQRGSPGQFQPQCKYLQNLGMVAITADYRVASRQGVKADSCVSDAKSAIRWVRANADRLGIDPNRIVASGGSAGGHLAVSTALLPGFDEPGEDRSVSSVPNAMVLFNPAVMLAPLEGKSWPRLISLEERLGTDPESISPIHHVRGGLPPAIIFHGDADETIPFWSVELFTTKMKEAANDCTLVGFEGKGHGFFNYRIGDGEAFNSTMRATEEFLRRLGYLQETGKTDPSDL